MKKYKGIILVAISAIVYGLMPAFAKIAYSGGSNPVELTFLRFFIGSISLLIIILRNKEYLFLTKNRNFNIIKISFWYSLTPVILFTSYNFISSGMATTFHFVYPIIVILLCALIFKTKISKVQLFSCLLCTLGVMAFSSTETNFNLFGAIAAIGSGLTYAIYIIYFSRFNTEGMSAFKFSFYLCLYSSLIILIPGLLTGYIKFEISSSALLAIIVLAISTSVISTVCFQEGVKIIGPQNASLVSTFEPLTSVIVGFFLFNEILNIISIIGILLILVSVILLTLEKQTS